MVYVVGWRALGEPLDVGPAHVMNRVDDAGWVFFEQGHVFC